MLEFIKKNPFLRYHLPLILFCLALFIQSSFPAVELPKSEIFATDKIAHFSAFAVLCFLFFYSLNNQNKSVKLKKYALEFALLFTVLYGISDEIHQSFVPFRDADIFDVIADFLGALFVYIIVKIIVNRKAKSMKSGLAVLALMLLGLNGCGSVPGYDSEDEETYYGRKHILNVNLDIFVEDVEAWYDMMPVVDTTQENFRFFMKITINKLENSFIEMDPQNFFITNFRIIFPEYTVKGKKPTLEYFKASDKSIEIKVFHDLKRWYTVRTKPLPEEVEFHLDLDYGMDLLKRIKTQKVKIKKVY